jgi:hypothetical protein
MNDSGNGGKGGKNGLRFEFEHDKGKAASTTSIRSNTEPGREAYTEAFKQFCMAKVREVI